MIWGDIPYQLGDRQLLPQDLLAAVLSQIKQEAGKMVQSHGENSLTKVVLTVPANYGDYKKRLMWKVAEQVGFTDVQFLLEPEAAAYYYNRNNIISYALDVTKLCVLPYHAVQLVRPLEMQ